MGKGMNNIIKKGLVLAVILLFLSVSVIPSTGMYPNKLSTESSNGNTIYVDDDNTEGPWDGTLEHPYQYIRNAVSVAFDGDTIFIFEGDYHESKTIRIQKKLKIIGQNRDQTIVNGEETVFFIVHDNVAICNLTIISSEETSRYPATIQIKHNHCIVSGNRILHHGRFGIWVYSSCNIISKNIITGHKSPYWFEAGIYMTGHNGFNIISKNLFKENGIGILFEFSPAFNLIINNDFIQNDCHSYFFDAAGNRWIRNYWDDYVGLGPYKIDGKTIIGPSWDPRVISVYRLDLLPRRNPHFDIEV